MNFKQLLKSRTLLASIVAAIVNGGIALLFAKWLGWSSWSLILFWLIITPLVLSIVPRYFVQSYYRLIAALLACLLFYTALFVIIFLDYQSQFNNIMLFGMIISIITILALYLRSYLIKRKYPK